MTKERWASVERIFFESGINYSHRSWFYLCEIEGRQFYYSPRTGKWRLKGKRVWQLSDRPEDFIKRAREYSPPGNGSRGSSHSQQKSRDAGDRRSSHSQQKSRQSQTQTGSSSGRHRTEQRSEIRFEFLERFGEYLQQQRERHYKIGWIWYSLLDQLVPTPLEICWLCVVFEYSPWWAFYKIEDLYGGGDRDQIFATIFSNSSRWMDYFRSRWGIREEDNSSERTSKPNEAAGGVKIDRYHLDLLRVSFPFTRQELKSAYRKRALETHPDSGGTAEMFRKIHTAYQVLLSYAS